MTFPGAPEVTCDGIDQGCDGPGDEAPDADADGYDVCDASDPGDQDGLAGDCADANYDRNPNTPEIACDGIDNDCDGTIDVPGLACGDLAVTNLRFAPGSKRALTWSSAPAADAYAMHRGTIEPAGMRGYDHRCAGAELPTPGAEDHDVPPLGSAYYYLATGVSIDSGSGSFDNGPLGVDSAGMARPDSVSVPCGARVYVDPDALAGNGTGLSWADAYTTVSGALRHSRGKSRALTVWMRGVVADETSLLTGGAAYRGLRVLGASRVPKRASGNETPRRIRRRGASRMARGSSMRGAAAFSSTGVRIDAGST
ncbi:MAG: hypothetical protein HC882_10150, partial [Acidobacteria bacterium]|nr:hypothetical protein [Acidobacteriota bacterium]